MRHGGPREREDLPPSERERQDAPSADELRGEPTPPQILAAGAPPPLSPQTVLALQRTAGNACVARLMRGRGNGDPTGLARQPVDAPPAPKLELVGMPGSLVFGSDVIQGPLAPGDRREGSGLTVEQTNALEARITYGESTVTIRADDGGKAYAFAVGPPGPEHEPELPSFGSGGMIRLPDPTRPRCFRSG